MLHDFYFNRLFNLTIFHFSEKRIEPMKTFLERIKEKLRPSMAVKKSNFISGKLKTFKNNCTFMFKFRVKAASIEI